MYLIPVGHLILLFCMISIASPAFASTIQANVSRTDLANATMTLPGWHRPQRHIRSGRQENNQYVRANVNNADNKDYWGHDQGNTGNHGHNRGYNEDNSSNASNQIINRGRARYSRNNQHYQIIINNAYNLRYFGYRQGNSGNSGYDEGYNRDNSGNLGNQIIN